jgi:potassium-transporting ATPase KdpC subunit
MSIFRDATRALRMTLVLWIITAIIYPLTILGVGQVFFSEKANGSLVRNLQGESIGSALIGQRFTSDQYFHPRPSTVRYSQGKNAKPTGISGASNLAPSNPDLLNRIVEEANRLRDDNIPPLADLIYTSGSGLDPHITVTAARDQLERVTRARNLRPDEVRSLIDKYTDGRFIGIFGEPGVNVLKLNYALDIKQYSGKESK